MKKEFVSFLCPGDVPEEPPIIKGKDELIEDEE